MILQELQPFNYKITEKRKRPGVLLALEGTLQKADIKNANNRIYPRKIWQKVVDDKDIQERLTSKRMVGQLDHPTSGITDPEKISHVVTSQKLLSDGTITGTIDVLDTPSGKIAATLFEAGVQLGVSSRGDGSVEDKGEFLEVQDDYRLETYDIVLKPSTPGAFPSVVESEENASKNVSVIIDAVDSLVRNTDDLEILLECFKIVSAIDEQKTKRDDVLKNLKSKLRKDKEINLKDLEDNLMSKEDIKGTENKIELSSEMRDYMKEWVDKGISEAVEAKNDQINKLNDQVVQLTDEVNESGKQLEAAKALIDEFTRKVKDFDSKNQVDEELSEKYEASTQLLNEALSRLEDSNDVSDRLAAAEALLETTLEIVQTQSINEYLDNKFDELGVSEEDREKLVQVVGVCESIEEVDSKLESLLSFISTKPKFNKEPLPGSQVVDPSSDSSLNEKVPTTNQDLITKMMLERLSGSNIQ